MTHIIWSLALIDRQTYRKILCTNTSDFWVPPKIITQPIVWDIRGAWVIFRCARLQIWAKVSVHTRRFSSITQFIRTIPNRGRHTPAGFSGISTGTVRIARHGPNALHRRRTAAGVRLWMRRGCRCLNWEGLCKYRCNEMNAYNGGTYVNTMWNRLPNTPLFSYRSLSAVLQMVFSKHDVPLKPDLEFKFNRYFCVQR